MMISSCPHRTFERGKVRNSKFHKKCRESREELRRLTFDEKNFQENGGAYFNYMPEDLNLTRNRLSFP